MKTQNVAEIVEKCDDEILALAGKLFNFSIGADFEGSMIREIRPNLQVSGEREFLGVTIELVDGREISKEILPLPLRVR